MKLARINVMVSPDEKEVLFRYKKKNGIKSLDEATGALLVDFEKFEEQSN